MARKVLAVLCLAFAGGVLLTGLMMLSTLSLMEDMVPSGAAGSRAAAADVHILGAMGAVLTLAGIGMIFAGAALWDFARARMVFGVTLTTVGGYLACMAFVFYTMRMEPSTGNMPEQALLFVDRLVMPSLLLGLAHLAVGVPLILYQRRLDRRPIAPPPLPPTALENTPPGR